MLKIKPDAITAEEMAKIDQKAAEFGIPPLLLMENAGSAVAQTAMEKFGHKLKIIIFAGTGNNGGDGFVAARHLANRGAKVDIFLIGRPDDTCTEEARLNWNVIQKMRQNIKIHVIRNSTDLGGAQHHLKRANVIIDAMLGTGLKGSLREPFASAVQLINESRRPVISVDTPTGLNPSTGEVHGTAVKATCTVTFHKMKKGFPKAREYTGEIIIAEIGIPREVETATIDKHKGSGQRIARAPERGTKLVSACLLGINCRYNGRNCLNKKVMRLAAKGVLIPVCPEQLGGLGTPREPMGIIGGAGLEVLNGKAKVINKNKKDVTKNLVKGAEETLKIAKSLGAQEAILKTKSPSCGCGKVYGWTFPNKLVKGDGVTAALLKKNGIQVITEKDL